MAEPKIRELPFIKEVKPSVDFSSYPDVSLQPDIPAANQIKETTSFRELPFLEKSDFEIFGVPQYKLEEGGEKMKTVIDTVVQDVKNLYGDVGVPEEAKIPASEEEKKFFGFNTDLPTTDVPLLTDKTGIKVIDFPKLKEESTSTYDFITKIGKHISKDLIGKTYALGDLALKTTFLPIQVPISITGATLEEMGKDLGEEKLQDIEEKLFGSRTIKPDEIKEAFEESSHILLADLMSRAPKPSQKQIFKDVAKQEKIDPKIIVEENVKPKADDIIEKTVDAFADEISKTQNRPKEEVKTEILNKIDQRQKEANKKIEQELSKNKDKETVQVTVGTAEEIAAARKELKDLKTRHEQEKIETFGEDWLTKNPKELTQQQRDIYESFYARQSKELNEVVQKVKALEKKKTVSNKQKKDFSIPKQTKQQQAIPNYVENAIQMAADFNYQAIWNPGPKYRHMNLGVEVAGKDAPAKLIRREEILAEFVKDLDVGIGVGKKKNALGYIIPKYETIRLKYKNDIDTAAHEIGHFLDKRIDKISDKYKNDLVMNKELRDISYDVNVVQEGFAEFIRAYLGNPKEAQKLAPNFYAWFDKTLREDGLVTKIKGKDKSVKKSVLNAQSNFAKYFNQDPLKRIDSKIGTNVSVNSKRMNIFEDLLSDTLDSLIGIERMEKDLASIDAPIYKRASNLRQGDSILKLAIEIGLPKATRNKDGFLDVELIKGSKPLRDILSQVADDMDNFIRYIVAKSAKELRQQNREKLFNDVEIAAGLKLENPKFKKVFEEYQDWNKKILDFAVEYGEIITRKQIETWNRTWYVPFWRAMSGTPKSRFSSTPTSFSGIKALTGGTENLRPIIENILGNAQMLISESIKNRMKLDIVDFAIKNRAYGSGRFITPIPVAKAIGKDRAIVKDIKNQLYENLFGIFPEIKNIKNFDNFKDFLDWSFDELGSVMNVMTVGKKPRGYESLMPVVRNGKTLYFEVTDPLLFRAIQGLDKTTPIFKGIFQLLTVPKKIKQSSITLSADFLGANFIRDTITSSIMSQSGYTPLVSALRGIRTRFEKDALYKEWMANGGDLAGYYINEGLFKNKLKSFYTKKGIDFNKVANTPRELYNMLEELASYAEVASRLGEYRKAREQGVSIAEAVYRSKNISVDFSKRGAYETAAGKTVQFLSELIPFFRAGLLGSERVYRGFVKDPNRAKIARRLGLLSIGSGVLAIVNSHNPIYQSLEDWDKDTHWHFIIPKWDRYFKFIEENGRPPVASYEEAIGYNAQTGESNPYFNHYRIPKIWEIGAVTSAAERTLINVLGSAKSKDDYTKIANTILNTYNLNLTDILGGAATGPLLETFFANRNTFTDRPIEYEYEQKLEPGERGEGRVTKTIAKVGKTFNISPPQVEHLIRGYFGTWANYGLLASDQFFFNDAEDLPLEKYPVIRRFTSPLPNRNNKYVNEAYNAMDEITTMVSTLRAMKKRFDPEGAYDWLQTYAKDQNMTEADFTKFLEEQENVKNQLNKKLIDFNADIGAIDNIGDINQLLKVAQYIGNKYGKINYLQTIYNQGLQNSIGGLKKFLKDDLYVMRNKLATQYVEAIERMKQGE